MVWLCEAQLDNIFEYYRDKATEKVATKIVRSIILKTNKLIEKMIYSVDEENHLIKIADVFDTRQNPAKLKRNK